MCTVSSVWLLQESCYIYLALARKVLYIFLHCCGQGYVSISLGKYQGGELLGGRGVHVSLYKKLPHSGCAMLYFHQQGRSMWAAPRPGQRLQRTADQARRSRQCSISSRSSPSPSPSGHHHPIWLPTGSGCSPSPLPLSTQQVLHPG